MAFSTVLKGLFKKFVLLAVVLTLLLILVELALWLVAPVPRYPRFSYTLTTELPGVGKTSTFEIDAASVRRYENSETEDREKEVKLLVIGGGLAYQLLQDAENTWWGLTAKELEEDYPEIHVSTMVRACVGPTPFDPNTLAIHDGVRWARRHLKELRPDIVIVAFGVSEVFDVPAAYRFDPTRMGSLHEGRGSWKDFVTGFSQIARRVRQNRVTTTREFEERKGNLEVPNYYLKEFGYRRKIYQEMPFGFSPSSPAEGRDPIQEYLAGLDAFERMSKGIDAELIVLGEPSLHDNISGERERRRLHLPRWLQYPNQQNPAGDGRRPDPAWVESELNRYYSAAGEWCEERSIPFVSLNEEIVLPKDTRHFVDDTMLTDAGNEQVVTVVKPLLTDYFQKLAEK